MVVVQAIREAVVRGLGGLVGVVCGALGVVALGVAALVPAILGLLAFVFSPLRAAVDRVRRPSANA
jgi:predicted Co/Zn/Cd cation transporter (cation efflux family)